MGYNEKLFLLECQKLKEDVDCDFVGVALMQHGGLEVNWPFVYENTNDKYKYITVRYGKGIAGKVISSGSSMKIVSFPENIIGKSTDYPIMLAEKLITAYAVPLLWNGIPKGALLIGYRNTHEFNEDNYSLVKKSAQNINTLLPSYFAGN